MYMNQQLFIDFLQVKEIMWTGINFSKAKFTKQGFDYPQEIIQHYFHDWNLLILNDQKKYDIRMSFRKPVMKYDLSQTTKLNKSIKVAHLLAKRIDIKDLLTEEALCEYVKTLEYPTEFRFALSFIVESFDTTTKKASIWVVITETTDKEMVLCENFLLTPSGFGTRNYWARTFYNLLFDIKSYAFLRWENMVQNEIDETTSNPNIIF